MPIYEYKCNKCEKITNICLATNEYKAELPCDSRATMCSGTLKRTFTVPHIYWKQGSPTK